MEEWIGAQEAATIMSDNSGHPVSIHYVRLLSNLSPNRMRSQVKHGRKKLYLREDVEAYRVRGNGKNKVVQAV